MRSKRLMQQQTLDCFYKNKKGDDNDDEYEGLEIEAILNNAQILNVKWIKDCVHSSILVSLLLNPIRIYFKYRYFYENNKGKRIGEQKQAWKDCKKGSHYFKNKKSYILKQNDNIEDACKIFIERGVYKSAYLHSKSNISSEKMLCECCSILNVNILNNGKFKKTFNGCQNMCNENINLCHTDKDYKEIVMDVLKNLERDKEYYMYEIYTMIIEEHNKTPLFNLCGKCDKNLLSMLKDENEYYNIYVKIKKDNADIFKSLID